MYGSYGSYNPSYNALDPFEYGRSDLFTGYTLSANRIGAPTKPDTANQIAEVSSLLNQGMKTIEVGALSPEVFETIPQQHFKEIEALTKLTGSDVTVHAPLIDPSGFSREGWSETQRQQAERQLKDIIKKSHEMSPEGNVPVTIHASGIPAFEWQKSLPKETAEKAAIIVVDQQTGQLVASIRTEERYIPGKGKVIIPAEKEIEDYNKRMWTETLSGEEYYKRIAESEFKQAEMLAKPIMLKEDLGRELTEEEKEIKREALERVKEAYRFLERANNTLRIEYDLANKYEENKKNLEKLREKAKSYAEYVEMQNKILAGKGREEISLRQYLKLVENGLNATSSMIEGLSVCNPKRLVPVDEFALKHSAKTIGNVAFDAFNSYGNKAPIIAVENVFPEMAFSRADQLRKLVEESRKQFVQNAIKKGIKEDDAEKAAESLIGVTWDLGHINLLRKAGYTEEEIIKETKKIAPYIKKVHMTDNFGFNDTHLPPGMGNVPIKKLMEELEKQGFSKKVIMEAGGFVQHFRTSPHPYVLEALGSPIYEGKATPIYGPEMRHAYGSYFLGVGMLPEQHFSMYGTGFSALPSELGGQIPGKQSRLTGTPID